MSDYCISSDSSFYICFSSDLDRRALTPQQRDEYKKNRGAHHGEVGCIMLAAGVGGESPALAGLGAGLMISDRKDANEWFRKTC